MECRGKIIQISRNFKEKGVLVALSLADAPVQELQALKSLNALSVSFKKYHKKRSLDANAYCWVLISRIAEVLQSSKEEIYEEMLQKYGCYYEDENGYITITVKSRVDMSAISGHWKFYKGNEKFKSYLMIKGSSQYDSAEMARFIDSVVGEAAELGIQTETPDEIARMKALWKGSSK